MAEPITAVAAVAGASQASSASKAAKSSSKLANTQADIALRQAEMAEESWQNFLTNYQPHILDQLESESELLPTRQEAIQKSLDAQITDRDFYEEKYRPIESQLADEAGLDRSEQVAGEAIAEVERQSGIARDSNRRRQQAYGIDPSSGRSDTMESDVSVQTAAQKAQAANQARRSEYDQGINRRLAVLGRGAALGRMNTPNTIPTPNTPITPSSVASMYSGAGGSLGGAASTQAGLAKMYSADAGSLSKGLTNIFMQGKTGSGIGGTPNSTPGGGGGYLGGYSGFADGGPVPDPTQQPNPGGIVRGPGNGQNDQVPAYIEGDQGETYDTRLSSGEYVIPEDVVRAKGSEFFDKLIERYHDEGSAGNNMPVVAGINRGGY